MSKLSYIGVLAWSVLNFSAFAQTMAVSLARPQQ